jgi:cleavage and polyadenylation specificity factor subunit 5
MSTIHLYPLKNYSSTPSDCLLPPLPYPTLALYHRDQWLQRGMRKSIQLLLLAHDDGIPCVLVQRTSSYSLLEGEILPGQTEEEAIKAILIRHLMKHSANDRLEFSVADCLMQLWRPEFDKNLFPYLPAHVSRPKELLKVVLVGLPPRAVLQLPTGVTLDAVPVAELKRGGERKFGPVLAAVPDIISRVSFKMLVPQQ